jgi:hypothetical protein
MLTKIKKKIRKNEENIPDLWDIIRGLLGFE